MARAEISGVMLGVALCVAPGCGSSGGSPGKPEAASPVEADAPKPKPCADLQTRGVLATFAGRTCPWSLRPTEDARVELVHSLKDSTSVAGDPPPPCDTAPCTYRGIETTLGAFVVVEIADAASELPAGVWLGSVREETLRFVDLWEDAGGPVVDDGVALGPSHALAPFDCEGTVALLVTPRIPGAASIPPPDTLLHREGPVDSGAAAVKRERCEPLPLGLP